MLNCRVLTKTLIKIKKKHLLVESELNKLKTFDPDYFTGINHFEEDCTQNCLVFQAIYRYFKTSNSDYVLSWTSKRFSNESITPASAPNHCLSPSLKYLGTKIRVEFSGSCLK